MPRVEIESEVTGRVWKVQVKTGDSVSQGDVLIIFESMKMEIPLESPVAGRVSELLARSEDMVVEGQIVVVLDT